MNDEDLDRVIKHADPSENYSILYSLAIAKQSEIIAAIENSIVAWLRQLWAKASRFKKMFISSIAVLSVGVFGTTSTLVARNSLSERSVRMIDEDCTVSGENALLVQSGLDSLGTVIEYWTVESNDIVLHAILRKGNVDGASGMSYSCDQKPRKAGQPFVGYSGYASHDLVEHSAYFGWIPPDSVGLLELSDNTLISIHPNAKGYFLVSVDGLQFPFPIVRLYIHKSDYADPVIINPQLDK